MLSVPYMGGPEVEYVKEAFETNSPLSTRDLERFRGQDDGDDCAATRESLS